MWRNWNLCAFLIGILIAVAVENSLAVPQSLNAELSYDPAIPLLGIPPKEPKTRIRTHIHILMFIVALFTTVKRWKCSKCLWVDDWINEMWYIHTMEHYSAIEQNETMWMKLEISQARKDDHYIISLIWDM